MRDLNLKPEYLSSHALITGIDTYENAPPMHHATSDAKAEVEIIREIFYMRSRLKVEFILITYR